MEQENMNKLENKDAVNYDEIDISLHAKQRYAERTMGKDDKQDINLYVNKNNDLIRERILKMYQYSTLFYEGVLRDKQQAKFYINKQNWVLIVSKNGKTIITLYKIECHFGEEVDKLFVQKGLETINECKERLAIAIQEKELKAKALREQIEDRNARIKEYEKLIKIMKAENDNDSDFIQNQQSVCLIIEQEVKEHIENFVSKKMF